MHLNFFSLLTVLVGTLLTGCGLSPIVGSGVPVTVAPGNEAFSAASFSHGCSVEIESSDSAYVEVTIDDNLREYLRVSQDGLKLTVGLAQGNWYRPTVFRVRVGSPRVNDLTASGGSKISATTELAMGSGASLSLSGGSSFSAPIHTTNIGLHLSGGSSVAVSGEGGNVTMHGSGGSIINMDQFSAANCTVTLSGGSTAQIHASGILSGALSGGSTLSYSGPATRGTISLSGGAQVKRR